MSLYSKLKGDLSRFGLIPFKRFGNHNIPPIMTITIPKAGTGLVQQILTQNDRLYRSFRPTLGARNITYWKHAVNVAQNFIGNNQILSTHWQFDEEIYKTLKDAGINLIFVYRAPQDTLISDIHYWRNNKKHRLNDITQTMDFEQLIRLRLYGSEKYSIESLEHTFSKFMGWKSKANYSLNYDELNLASDEEKQQIIFDLMEAVEQPITLNEVKKYTSVIGNPGSPTFRRGVVGKWREGLSDKLISEIEVICDHIDNS